MAVIHRYPDPESAAPACAGRMLALLEQAIADRGQASLAISGGSSPKKMFQIFEQTSFAWNLVHVFWVDERGVPPDDPQSNYKMTNDVWLAPSKFPLENVHRVQGELPPEEAAAAYREDIRRFFNVAPELLPQFDVIHRGMGSDGHTASLFPGEPAIVDLSGTVAAVWVEKMRQHRITLLPGVLEAARHTVMLVTGPDKAVMLPRAVHGTYDPMVIPAQLGRDGSIEWFVDEAAAEGLTGDSIE